MARAMVIPVLMMSAPQTIPIRMHFAVTKPHGAHDPEEITMLHQLCTSLEH